MFYWENWDWIVGQPILTPRLNVTLTWFTGQYIWVGYFWIFKVDWFASDFFFVFFFFPWHLLLLINVYLCREFHPLLICGEIPLDPDARCAMTNSLVQRCSFWYLYIHVWLPMVTLRICLCFLLTERSKPSWVQAAMKRCVRGLEDYLHCNKLNS